jgi:hypothetical protein
MLSVTALKSIQGAYSSRGLQLPELTVLQTSGTSYRVEAHLPETEHYLSIKVFDMSGRKVQDLFSGYASAELILIPSFGELPRGSYFISLDCAAGNVQQQFAVTR